MHVTHLYLVFGISKWLQRLLDDQREIISRAPERPIERGHTKTAILNQSLEVPLLLSAEVLPSHQLGPFCRMYEQSPNRLRPECRIPRLHMTRHAGRKRARRTCISGDREWTGERLVVRGQQSQRIRAVDER